MDIWKSYNGLELTHDMGMKIYTCLDLITKLIIIFIIQMLSINNFILVRKLGSGHASEVWQVQYKHTPQYQNLLFQQIKNFVLKIVNKSGCQMPYREESYLRRCEHPNVTKLYTSWNTIKINYLLFEYVAGKDAFTIVHNNKEIPIERVRHYFKQLADVLHYIHSCGIVHHDIKLENILITDNHRLILLDFGLAIDQKAIVSKARGTLDYIPDEALGMHIAEPSIDWWAAGIVLSEFITTEIPTETILNTLPLQVRDLIEHLVAVNPQDRYQGLGVLNHPWLLN